MDNGPSPAAVMGNVKVWEGASKQQIAKWQEEERTAAAVEQAPANPPVSSPLPN